ncbi:tyrosine-type recombinase/integrase [Sphingomonas sp. GCM10030256]|uniref:tyrosine-type recombinase/integrase n=1 Tax=Sphingomonas sp. GCM10030256 TaxID=3273427 RepID=UPI0036114953
MRVDGRSAERRLVAGNRLVAYRRAEKRKPVLLRREDYGTHSLRRTKAALIYKQTGNLRAVQILLGHTKIETAVRYFGVEVEDALALAEATEI